ncbi:MAG TPA: protease inhibitor I42 family protein [Micromonosporaceae bacterium]|nr:protease inhibitor I42 family protein [Micromonosporaceae bacterium]
MIRLRLEDSDGVVTASPGELLEAVLPENAGTGYQWQVEPLPDGLELLGDRTAVARGDAAGAAGNRIFTVRVNGPGVFTARLSRAWEPAASARQTFTVKVVIDQAAVG